MRAGDILQLVNGETVVVELVQHEILENSQTFYNFAVDGNHNYYVAEDTEQNVNDFVLVHNKCYRDNLKKVTGIDPGDAAQAHHRLPQTFRKEFMSVGLDDIDDVKYLQWVASKEHSKGSKAYNKLWQEFFDSTPNYTADDVLAFMKQDNVWNFFKTWMD